MADTALDLVAQQRAGTGSAFIIDQQTATAPLRVYGQLQNTALRAAAQQQRIRAQQAAAADREFNKTLTVGAPITSNHVQRAEQGMKAFIADAAAARRDGSYAKRAGEFAARQQSLLTDRLAGAAVDKGLADHGIAFKGDKRAMENAPELFRHAVVYDENENERSPAEQAEMLRKMDPMDPKFYDSKKTYGQVIDGVNEQVRREIIGSRAPGSKFTEQQVASKFGIEYGPDGSAIVDKSGNYVFSDKGVQQFRDMLLSDPIGKGVLMRDVQAAQQAWQAAGMQGPEPSIDSVAGQQLVNMYRPDVQNYASREPYAPQPRAKSAADELKPTEWAVTEDAGSSEFGNHGAQAYTTITETVVDPVTKLASRVTRDAPAAKLSYANLSRTPTSGGATPTAVRMDLPVGTLRVLPNGRKSLVKANTQATIQNPSIQLLVTRKDGVPVYSKPIPNGDTEAVVAELTRQVDEAVKTGGVLQYAVVGDVLDKDPVVGDGVNAANRGVTTDDGTVKDDPLRTGSVSRIINPMTRQAAGQFARKTPGFDAYSFTDAQRRVLQEAFRKLKPSQIKGIPPDVRAKLYTENKKQGDVLGFSKPTTTSAPKPTANNPLGF